MKRPLTLLLALLPACAPPPPRHAAPAALEPLREPSVYSDSPWSWLGMSGRRIRTPHYLLHTTESSPDLLDRFPRFLEAAITHYTTAFGPLPEPPQPLNTYFFAHRWQWERATLHIMREQADVFLRIQRGGFAADGLAVYYNIGPRDAFSVAAHEGWHQYTQSVFKDPLPMWLEEGIATTMEGFRWDLADFSSPRFLPWANVERFDLLRSAHRDGRLLTLQQVLDAAPQNLLAHSHDDALTWYAQVWALTLFILHDDDLRPRLTLCLQQAADGRLYPLVQNHLGPGPARRAQLRRVGPEVFSVAFSQDLDDANRRYLRFISLVTAPGNRQRVVQGLPPLLPTLPP